MSKQFALNINECVSFRLTERGAFLWNSSEDSVVKAGDLLRCQLWQVMQALGKGMYLGTENPIVDCIILVDEKNLQPVSKFASVLPKLVGKRVAVKFASGAIVIGELHGHSDLSICVQAGPDNGSWFNVSDIKEIFEAVQNES